MNRRDILSTVLKLGATGSLFGIVGSNATEAMYRFVNDRLATDPAPINSTEASATVVERSASGVTVQIGSPDQIVGYVPVAYRQPFPDGRALERREGTPIVDDGSETTVEFDFDESVASAADQWYYEIRCRPSGDSRRDEQYLCESDPEPAFDGNPLRTLPSVTGVERYDRPGRYEIRHQFTDHDGDAESFSISVGKAAYARALERSDGYVRTFRESRTNPFARHLTAAVAETIDTTATSALDGRSETKLLNAVVRFVQTVDYVEDIDSAGRYEYHRSIAETLVAGQGDCKDCTYLLAGALSQLPFDYDTALVLMPDHLLLGVARSDLPEEHADADTINDSPYVAIESTVREPIGEHQDQPIVAIVGDDYQFVDPDTFGTTLSRQLDLFAEESSGAVGD